MEGLKPDVAPIRPCVPDGTHPQCHTWVEGNIVGALVVYVDGLLVSAPLDIHKAFMAALRTNWSIAEPEFLGPGDNMSESLRFLGMDIDLDPEDGHLVVHQQVYIQDVLVKYAPLYQLRPKDTPRQPESFAGMRNLTKSPDQGESLFLVGVIGSLLSISLRTRPDITWAVPRVASLVASGPELCKVRLKHLLQYLHHTINFGLKYTSMDSFDGFTHVYTDASLCPTGEKSHQGVAITLGPNLISWASNRQALVALSSAEAELIALVFGLQLGESIRAQISEWLQTLVTLRGHCDNAVVVRYGSQLSYSASRTRHLAMRAAWVYDLCAIGHPSLTYVSTSEQVADALTKGLSALKNQRARLLLCLTTHLFAGDVLRPPRVYHIPCAATFCHI